MSTKNTKNTDSVFKRFGKMGLPKYRKVKYITVSQLNEAIDKYFQDCIKYELTPNKAGLALALGFSGSEIMRQYRKRHIRFEGAFNRAVSIIEGFYNTILSEKDNKNSNGPWRYLQHAFHYTERSTTDLNVTDKVIRMPAKRSSGKAMPKLKKAKKTKKAAVVK